MGRGRKNPKLDEPKEKDSAEVVESAKPDAPTEKDPVEKRVSKKQKGEAKPPSRFAKFGG
jgi:hypothetical protein